MNRCRFFGMKHKTDKPIPLSPTQKRELLCRVILRGDTQRLGLNTPENRQRAMEILFDE